MFILATTPCACAPACLHADLEVLEHAIKHRAVCLADRTQVEPAHVGEVFLLVVWRDLRQKVEVICMADGQQLNSAWTQCDRGYRQTATRSMHQYCDGRLTLQAKATHDFDDS